MRVPRDADAAGTEKLSSPAGVHSTRATTTAEAAPMTEYAIRRRRFQGDLTISLPWPNHEAQWTEPPNHRATVSPCLLHLMRWCPRRLWLTRHSSGSTESTG